MGGSLGLKCRVNLGLNYRSLKKGGSFTGEGISNTTADLPSTASLEPLETNQLDCGEPADLRPYRKTPAERCRYVLCQTDCLYTFRCRTGYSLEYFQILQHRACEGTITVNPDSWNYQKSGLMSWMGRVMYTLTTIAICFDGDCTCRRFFTFGKGH